jgi:hypothetical protein
MSARNSDLNAVEILLTPMFLRFFGFLGCADERDAIVVPEKWIAV